MVWGCGADEKPHPCGGYEWEITRMGLISRFAAVV